MARRRWIADEVNGDRAALTGAHAAHLSKVLRAVIGQEFDIATGSEVRRARVSQVDHDRVEFELGVVVESAGLREISVALAVFKFDRFEWAIEKCTELGVSRIIPVVTRRTDPHLAAAAEKRVERWRRIVREASEQSRRNAVPEIAAPLKLKQYLQQEQTVARVVLAETEREIQLRDLVAGEDPLVLAIGPEGGWAEDELRMFGDAGWQQASLGETILRAETAAIAALAVARSAS